MTSPTLPLSRTWNPQIVYYDYEGDPMGFSAYDTLPGPNNTRLIPWDRFYQIDWPTTIDALPLAALSYNADTDQLTPLPAGWQATCHPKDTLRLFILTSPSGRSYFVHVYTDGNPGVTTIRRRPPQLDDVFPLDEQATAQALLGGSFFCWVCGHTHHASQEAWRACVQTLNTSRSEKSSTAYHTVRYEGELLSWTPHLDELEARKRFLIENHQWSATDDTDWAQFEQALQAYTVTTTLPGLTPVDLADPNGLERFLQARNQKIKAHDIAKDKIAGQEKPLLQAMRVRWAYPHGQEPPGYICHENHSTTLLPATQLELERVRGLLGPTAKITWDPDERALEITVPKWGVFYRRGINQHQTWVPDTLRKLERAFTVQCSSWTTWRGSHKVRFSAAALNLNPLFWKHAILYRGVLHVITQPPRPKAVPRSHS